MKKIEFPVGPVIPQDGIVVLIRNNNTYVQYKTDEDTNMVGGNLFFPIGRGVNYIHPKEITNIDKLYVFPKNEDIYKTLSHGQCLDKILLKSERNDKAFGQVIFEKLEKDITIGMQSGNTKYHAKEKIGGVLRIFNKEMTKCDISDFAHSAYAWYEFDNIYELGKWMCS